MNRQTFSRNTFLLQATQRIMADDSKVEDDPIVLGQATQRIMAEDSKVEDDPIVLVPGGPRRRSTVFQIDNGHSLDMANGRVLQKHVSGRVTADLGPVPTVSEDVDSTLTRKPNPAVQWIINATWKPPTNRPITQFKTTWVVPPAPKTDNAQTIYLFNGLQNPSWIYQPVLQWGTSPDPNGGNYWTVASWLADGQYGPAFYSPLVRVQTGDVLTGVMTLLGSRNIGSNTIVTDWDCCFEGIPGTCLPVRGVQQFNNAVEVLEAYNSSPVGLPPSNCSDYPFALKTAMTNIEITWADGEEAVTWGTAQNITTCGQNCVIVSDASPGGEVDLNYFSPAAPAVPRERDRLRDTQGLLVGQSLTSSDTRFQLILQSDGNLVLYGPQHQPLWASNTAGHLEVWDLVLQNGDLIMHDVLGGTIWTSGSNSTSADVLVVQPNGNVVLSNSGGEVWQTNTVVPFEPVASTTAGKLLVNDGLVPGGSVISTDKRFTFTLQGDGNLVLYGPVNQPLWASNTAGHEDVWSLVMQDDGNLVIYDGNNKPFWASNTNGHPGATLTVQDDGNTVIYDGTTAIWSTQTVVPTEATEPDPGSDTLVTGQGFIPGQSIKSSDGRFTLILQGDGNLVLYGPQNQPLWASNTAGHTDVWDVIMQGDGNFVVYDSHKVALWASGTAGHASAYLVVQDDGNVVIYNVNDTSIWATNTVVPAQPTPASGDRLPLNECLVPGSSLRSPNGQYTWTLQLDGNLVLYGPSPCNQVMWASNTAGHSNVWSLVLQSDGNLVAYDAHDGAFFASNTVGDGGEFVVVQDDGNVVMYNSTGTALWSTGTALPPTPSPPSSTNALGVNQGLSAGQALTSVDSRYTFTLQTDANIVLYGPGNFNAKPQPPVAWASNTNGHLSYPWFLAMQGDGNLVAYDSNGKAYWASNTNGHPGATLSVLATGHVVVADPSGSVLWSRP